MVTIPKVLTNKTVLTGLAQSPLKSASLFPPANSGSPFYPIGSKGDVMGKAMGIVPAFRPGKIQNFKTDMTSFTSSVPVDIGRPNYIQRYGVSFR